MKETLLIEFAVENGKNTTISIPDPREDLTENEVYKAMLEILERRCLLTENGATVNGYKKAYLRIVDEQALP